MKKKSYTIDEAAKELNISKSMYYKLHRQGKAPKITKMGRRSIVLGDCLESYLVKLQQQSQA